MTRDLFFDISHWNEFVDFEQARAGGAIGVIIKYCNGNNVDDMAPIHYAGARKAGLIVGAYGWVDPTYQAESQTALYAQLLKQYPADFMAGDVEQWWANIDKYFRYCQGKLAKNSVPQLSSDRIWSVTNAWFNQMDAYRLGIPLLIYTRYSFIDEYCKRLMEIARARPNWIAAYPKPEPSGRKTWAQLPSVYFEDKMLFVPTGYPRPVIWQWGGDHLILPGHDGTVDLNFAYDIEKWIVKQAVPTVPTLSYIIRYLNESKCSALYVRPTPDTSKAPLRILNVTKPKTPIYCTTMYGGAGSAWVKLYNEGGLGKFKIPDRLRQNETAEDSLNPALFLPGVFAAG